MITYLELLQMIKEGRPPKKVKFLEFESEYKWDENKGAYVNERFGYILEDVTPSERTLISDKAFEVIDNGIPT